MRFARDESIISIKALCMKNIARMRHNTPSQFISIKARRLNIKKIK